MAEELGKIQKPAVSDYTGSRKLFFVPFLYSGDELPDEYQEKIKKYWKQVGESIADLSSRLGTVSHVFHELIATAGHEGSNMVKNMNPLCYNALKHWLKDDGVMKAVEDRDILTEFMDWNRCLYVGLENPRVTEQVYKFYTEAAKKRNAIIAQIIDETLKEGEIGILVFRENHQVQFPSDIEVFYIAPPALDEVKRWIRDFEASGAKENTGEKKSENN